MGDPPFYQPDLVGLSEQERSTLRLLAEGHTAKSIAALTGRSISSVNESLRRARRKASVGSSRELARLLKNENFGHEQFALSPSTEQARLRFRPILIGATVMTIISATIIAALFWPAPQEMPLPKADPLLSKLMPPAEREPRRLAEVMRTEARDPVWADRAEQALRQRYAPLVADERIKILRLTCGATVCEVVGSSSEKDVTRLNSIWQELQGPGPNSVAPEYQIEHAAISFGGNNLFAAYWIRAG